MKNAGSYFLWTMALLALSHPMVLADTLELKDGRLLEGTYMGGTRTTLRFRLENRVEVLPIQDALALTFNGPSPSASEPASTLSSENGSPQSSTAGPIVVPAGTRLLVRLVEGINSKEDSAGSRFTAVLEGNLKASGRVVAPKGSRVYGRLTSAKKGGRAFGKAQLQLELTDIQIDDQLQPIITGEYEVRGRSQGTAKNTVIGGVLGALIDGKDGAEKGAAAGFGYSLLSKGKQVAIPSGTLIQFRLEQPMTVQA